jgi:outer membrane protein assembly factor BamD (BamD/ComL family)
MNDRHLQRIVQLLEKLNERPEPIAEIPAPAPPEPAPAPVPEVAPTAAEPEVIPEPVAAPVPEPTEEPAVAELKPVEQTPTPEPEPQPEPEAEAPLIAAVEPTPVQAAAAEDVEPPVQLLEEEEASPAPAVEPVAPPMDPAQLELDPLHRQIDELLASSTYDLALAAANDFVRRYPQNPAGQELVKRIVHEAEVYVEQNTARLFDEIRSSVERRQWRRALELSQRLLEKFPEHPRAAKIRQQLRPIQHNAEMEERQVQEVRIQELIRARRYAESIDLCEDLIRRFPQSTQAATLTGLLPKLRERAAAEGAGAGSGVFAS